MSVEGAAALASGVLTAAAAQSGDGGGDGGDGGGGQHRAELSCSRLGCNGNYDGGVAMRESGGEEETGVRERDMR